MNASFYMPTAVYFGAEGEKLKPDPPRRHFQRFTRFAEHFRMNPFKRDAESFCEAAYEAVFFLGFLSQSVIDVKDDESFGGISLFAALCHQKGERHRIGAAAYRQPDASRRKNSVVDAHLR